MYVFVFPVIYEHTPVLCHPIPYVRSSQDEAWRQHWLWNGSKNSVICINLSSFLPLVFFSSSSSIRFQQHNLFLCFPCGPWVWLLCGYNPQLIRCGVYISYILCRRDSLYFPFWSQVLQAESTAGALLVKMGWGIHSPELFCCLTPRRSGHGQIFGQGTTREF